MKNCKIQRFPDSRIATIEIREILNMSILIDHDVIDGAPMARFINELNNSIETGSGIEM